jgi:pimeloyl-ACP methyl ester carboxylesterase
MTRLFLLCALWLCPWLAHAQTVVDIPSRPDVFQRMLVLSPEKPKAVLILFTGGNGALQINDKGELGSGRSNFLVRTRAQWLAKGFVVALVDAPSDRQSEPFLSGFRQTPQHLQDIKAVIAWLRAQYTLPIWLVGTSRGTQSAAFVATTLTRAEGPDGLVLTATILNDKNSRAVPAMALNTLTIPTLIVHHNNDECKVCPPAYLASLMDKLTATPRKALIRIDGGQTQGDPCESLAHHGFNGVETQVIDNVSSEILTP